MNSIRSNSRAISFLMRRLILASHASLAPFVLYGHPDVSTTFPVESFVDLRLLIPSYRHCQISPNLRNYKYLRFLDSFCFLVSTLPNSNVPHQTPPATDSVPASAPRPAAHA
jgi:hypothetical protein